MRAKVIDWLAKLALVMVSSTLTLTVLDLGIAVGQHLAGRDSMYMYDPVLGWRVLPNLDNARTPYPTYTDAHGFRILPGEPRDTHAYDVMLLGDSFCFGSWLSVEQTLAGMIKLNHPQLHIANTSVPGWGTDQELLALARYAPMLKPGGTVVLLTYVNDFVDIRDHWEEVREKPRFTLGAQGLMFNRPDSRLNRFLWSTRLFSITAYLAGEAFNLQPEIYGDNAEAAQLYTLMLERMAAIITARRARFVVLYSGGRGARTDPGLRWAAVVRKAAARVGAQFFSLDDVPGGLTPAMFRSGDIHWNAAGNSMVYRYIGPQLDPWLQPLATQLIKTAN